MNYIDLKTLKQTSACQEGIDFFKQNWGDKKTSFTEILSKEINIPITYLLWAEKKFIITKRKDRDLLDKRLDIANSDGVRGSVHILNSTSILNSKRIVNSKQVNDSRNVQDSNFIISSRNVTLSKNIYISRNIEQSTNMLNCYSSFNTDGAIDCKETTNCKNILMCSNVSNVLYSALTSNSNNCFGCVNVSKSDHCMFCLSMSGTYNIFNQQVSEQEYIVFMNEVQNILKRYENKIIFIPYPSSILIKNFSIEKPLSKFRELFPQELLDFLKNSKYYNEMIYNSIFIGRI